MQPAAAAPIARGRPAPPELLQGLAERFGERCSTGESVRDRHGRDESPYDTTPPDCVVFPEDAEEVAEVVRNLSIRDKDKGLSAGEKRMLQKARQILVSELTFAINVSEEEAEQKLNAIKEIERSIIERSPTPPGSRDANPSETQSSSTSR